MQDLHQGRDPSKRKPKSPTLGFNAEMLEALAKHEPSVEPLEPGDIALFIERIDAKGHVLRYGPIRDEELLRQAAGALP